jgi:hypothetical protein
MTDDRPGAPGHDTDDEHEAEPTLAASPSSLGSSVAAAVGGFMGGIEQQVFHRRPPAIEVVRQATPVRGTSGEGVEVTIDLSPPDPPAPKP